MSKDDGDFMIKLRRKKMKKDDSKSETLPK